MAESDFSLPKSSYAELSKMIHAYYLASRSAKGEPLDVPAVASQAGIDQTQLSRNNKFFAELGIISGGKKKKLEPVGETLGRGIDFNDDAIIRQSLADIVAGTDFLTRVVNAVRIRGGMDAPSLQNHIALTAGAAKSGPVMTGAAAVIELLLRSGRLVDDGGTLRVGQERASASDTLNDADEVSRAEAEPASAPRKGPVFVSSTARALPTTTTFWPSAEPAFIDLAGGRGTQPTINININIAAGEAGEVADTLRQILAVLSEPKPPSTTEPDDEQ